MQLIFYIKKHHSMDELYEWLSTNQPKNDDRWTFKDHYTLEIDSNGFFKTQPVIIFQDEKDYFNFIMRWQ